MISLFELTLIICVILLLNGIGWYWFKKQWNRRWEAYKKVYHKEFTEELSSDFHDEVGSHLAKIISLAGVLRTQGNHEEKEVYLDKIIESSKSMFSGFGTLLWTIQSDRTRCRDIYLEISDFGNNLFGSSNIKFECRIDDSGAIRYVIPKSVKDVLLSIKEILTNAIKHSKASSIKVDFNIDGALLFVKITDDGLGFSTDKVKASGGVFNLEKRSKRSNFSYTRISDKGSTILLSIPIEHV
jgi:glucose-6-phosphate-specific signal transduction histidine kinase